MAFSKEERAAMKERTKELKERTEGEATVLAKITEMPEPDRGMAGRIHEIVKAAAPHLTPRTWYGMPAYAKDGDVICFFQNSQKFKTRYSTLGFSDKAKLDDGEMWPSAYALIKLTPAVMKLLSDLIKKAAS